MTNSDIPVQAVVHRPNMHAAQRAILEHPARFRVVCAGRRLGKTRLGAWLCVETALHRGRAWWVAPNYPIANIGWRMIKRLVRQIPGTEIRETERMVILPDLGWIQVKSADTPDALRGEGLDLVVLDECAYVKEAAWTEALRPALSDRKGRALFISSPNGKQWFWRLYVRGLDSTQSDWQAWHFPTGDNPYIDPAEIESARASMPEQMFLQEFMAAFTEEAGGALRGVAEVSTVQPLSGPEPGRAYVMGADLGRHFDFTALSIFEVEGHREVYLERFNQLGWLLQIGRIRAAAARFGVRQIVIDQTGVGDAVVEQLRREMALDGDTVPVAGITLTAETKTSIIEAFALAIERRAILLLDDPVATAEAQAYERERLLSGRFRYVSPLHDDTVVARALGWWGCLNRAEVETAPNPFWG